jgi:hypothetical protein
VKLLTKAKADAGLWMLEEAILQLIREKGPMQPTEVGQALEWSGEWGGKVAYGVMVSLAENSFLEPTSNEVRPKYDIVPGKTH